MAVAMVEEARAAEVMAVARAAAATAVGAQGEVRDPVTWERAVVVGKGQGRMERAAAVKEAVTVAAATAEAMAEVTVAVAKAVETEVGRADCTPLAPRSHRTMPCHSRPTTWRLARGMWRPSEP